MPRQHLQTYTERLLSYINTELSMVTFVIFFILFLFWRYQCIFYDTNSHEKHWLISILWSSYSLQHPFQNNNVELHTLTMRLLRLVQWSQVHCKHYLTIQCDSSTCCQGYVLYYYYYLRQFWRRLCYQSFLYVCLSFVSKITQKVVDGL